MRVLIRADSDPIMGTGHVMRALALAQSLVAEGAEVSLACAQIDAPIADRVRAQGLQLTCASVVPGSVADVTWTAALCAGLGCEWVVTDGYAFTDEFQNGVHARGLRQLVIDDYGHCDSYLCELVVNQNSYASEALYPRRAPTTELLLGTRFALLRREFFAAPQPVGSVPAHARRIVVTMGGADPVNATATLLSALQALPDPSLQARVIVGAANPRATELEHKNRDARIEVLRQVTDMPAMMRWAQLAIAGAGTTTWELAFMGVPTLLVILAENQRRVAESMQAEGAAVNLGWHHALQPDAVARTLASVCADAEARGRMAARGQSLVDGRGGQRVFAAMARR